MPIHHHTATYGGSREPSFLSLLVFCFVFLLKTSRCFSTCAYQWQERESQSVLLFVFARGSCFALWLPGNASFPCLHSSPGPSLSLWLAFPNPKCWPELSLRANVCQKSGGENRAGRSGFTVRDQTSYPRDFSVTAVFFCLPQLERQAERKKRKMESKRVWIKGIWWWRACDCLTATFSSLWFFSSQGLPVLGI